MNSTQRFWIETTGRVSNLVLPAPCRMNCIFHPEAPSVMAIKNTSITLCMSCCEDLVQEALAKIAPDYVEEQYQKEAGDE